MRVGCVGRSSKRLRRMVSHDVERNLPDLIVIVFADPKKEYTERKMIFREVEREILRSLTSHQTDSYSLTEGPATQAQRLLLARTSSGMP